MDIDYKALLRRYICHVKDWEGISFLEYAGPFTADELLELLKLANEDGKIDEAEPRAPLARSPQWRVSMELALLKDLEAAKYRKTLYETQSL